MTKENDTKKHVIILYTAQLTLYISNVMYERTLSFLPKKCLKLLHCNSYLYFVSKRYNKTEYSRTSMARTLMARLPRQFRTRSRVPRKKFLGCRFGKGLGSIRGVFGPMPKISFTLSNYSFVIWDKNYRRYFVI